MIECGAFSLKAFDIGRRPMSWAAVATTLAESAGRNLCRPGWLELFAVVSVAAIAACVGCCCGVAWGGACGFFAGRNDAVRIAQEVGADGLQVARARLQLYQRPPRRRGDDRTD